MAEFGNKANNIAYLRPDMNHQKYGGGGGNMDNKNSNFVTQKEFYEMRLANEVAHARSEEKANSMDWKLNWILGLLTTVILGAILKFIVDGIFTFLN